MHRTWSICFTLAPCSLLHPQTVKPVVLIHFVIDIEVALVSDNSIGRLSILCSRPRNNPTLKEADIRGSLDSLLSH
ncbi:hypothetical protein C8R48DRAFT_300745 [Suillus tomentosus]|nr:hypothetical protein C8R48DRAFT_300745 [Suillus tomentosus]